MKRRICSLLLGMMAIIGLSACVRKEETKSAADGHSCVMCSSPATHFAGTGTVNNSPGSLYFCDSCYSTWTSNLDAPVVNGDFTDPDNFGKVIEP